MYALHFSDLYTSLSFSNIFTWQTYNALFIIRSISKYFIENLSEEVVIQQFETKSQENDGKRHSLLSSLKVLRHF